MVLPYNPLSLNQFTQAPLQGQTAYGYVPQKIAAIIDPNSTSYADIIPGTALKLVGASDQGGVIVDKADATDPVFGFAIFLTSKNTYLPGDAIDIAYSTNFMYMTTLVDLAAGDPVQIDASTNKVTLATGSEPVVGMVMQNVAAGELAIIYIVTPVVSNPIALSKFVGLQSVLDYSAGTWTRTRIAAGNYAQVKTAAANTSIIGIDITEEISAQSSKGFKLSGFRVIFSNATADLNSHAATLSKVVYANGVAVAVTSVSITGGTLPVGQAANPQIASVTVSSPAYDNTANSKYVVEVSIDAASSSAYAYYGLMLDFVSNK